ncbi:DNA polymerase III subunit alpha, partial [Candidatus Falkowbacteria bacterium]|nr:DNA polymerase III subunit alpha [Candidatus Falkowbacteria bacterium]
TYLHPIMRESLKNTYGVIVYQEQVMQLSKDMAGFTGGQADTLRKAMGKKIADLMEKMKKEFLEGCQNNKIPVDVAKQTFESMEKFAEYGFNKSHAACYALIAYQTAYLKANYPAEFMASLLTSDQNNMDRITIEIDECKQMGLEILPPSINESFSKFAVVAESLKEKNPRIRFGMSAIRNVGDGVASAIIHERKTDGNFTTIEDFLSRVGTKALNKKSLEGLMKSGALDLFASRSSLLENVDKLLLYMKEVELAKSAKQVNIFSLSNGGENVLPDLVLRDAPDFGDQQILAWEKEFLGLYVSEHPFSDYEKKFKSLIYPIAEVKQMRGEKITVRTGGVATIIKKIITKKGDPMLFVTIEDSLGSIETLIFPRLYRSMEKQDIWQEGNILVIEGTLSDKDGDNKILSSKVWSINQQTERLVISDLENQPTNDEKLKRLGQKQVIVKYPVGATKDFASQIKMLFIAIPGKHQVILKIDEKLIKTNFLIDLSDESRVKLESLLGKEAVLQG